MTQAEIDALQVGDMIAYDISNIWKITAFNNKHNIVRISIILIATQTPNGLKQIGLMNDSYSCNLLSLDNWSIPGGSAHSRGRDMYDKLTDILGQANFTGVNSVAAIMLKGADDTSRS